MSRSPTRAPVAGRADLPEHYDAETSLNAIDVQVQDLLKQTATVLVEDNRCYLSPREVGAQSQVSRLIYQLVGAREAIAEFKRLVAPRVE